MQKLATIVAIITLSVHAESITFDSSLSYEEKLNILKYDFIKEDTHHKKEISEFAR